MNDFRKEDPPVGHQTTRLADKYAELLEKVRADPGEWYRLRSFDGRNQSPDASRHVRRLREQTEGFEFKGSRGVIYARWIGTEAKP